MRVNLPPLKGKIEIPLGELTDEPVEIAQHRLRYHISRMGKCLRGLNASLPDGTDPGRLLLWLARKLQFPPRPRS